MHKMTVKKKNCNETEYKELNMCNNNTRCGSCSACFNGCGSALANRDSRCTRDTTQDMSLWTPGRYKHMTKKSICLPWRGLEVCQWLTICANWNRERERGVLTGMITVQHQFTVPLTLIHAAKRSSLHGFATELLIREHSNPVIFQTASYRSSVTTVTTPTMPDS